MQKNKTTIKFRPKYKPNDDNRQGDGKTSFRGGVHKSRRYRELDKNDKYGKRKIQEQLDE